MPSTYSIGLMHLYMPCLHLPKCVSPLPLRATLFRQRGLAAHVSCSGGLASHYKLFAINHVAYRPGRLQAVWS